MIFLASFVVTLFGIIAFLIFFSGMTYLNKKYDILRSLIGTAIFYFGIIIPVIITMIITLFAFYNIKGIYEVVDVKDNGFYSQEIVIEDDNNTYLLKDVPGEYEIGEKIELSVIYVEKNGNKIK